MGGVDPREGEGAVWVDYVVADVCIHLHAERNCPDSLVSRLFIGQCTSHASRYTFVCITAVYETDCNASVTHPAAIRVTGGCVTGIFQSLGGCLAQWQSTGCTSQVSWV